MRLRLLPILLTAAVSSFVLFGGWFLYHAVAKEGPLLETISAVEGVQEPLVHIGRDQVEITLYLTQDAHLAKVYTAVRQAAEEAAGGRKVKIDMAGEPDEELESLWASLLFDIAQAMDTMQYTDIPKRLQEAVQDSGGSLQAGAEMDEDHVYITLQNESSTKYIVLPRRPQTLGVWHE